MNSTRHANPGPNAWQGILGRRLFLLSGLANLTGLRAAAADWPNMQVLSPRETAMMEHADRKARLLRLADLKGIERPTITEEIITQAEHHLTEYSDLPLLRVVFRDRVLFDFSHWNLREEADGILSTIAASLRLEPPDVTVFIAGHTDSIGSAAYNLELGLKRARATAVSLVQLGVHQAQVFMVSFGKAVPIASNETEEGRSRNRRVEFLFSARPEPIAAWLIKQPVPTCTVMKNSKEGDCPNLEFTAPSVSLSSKGANVSLSNHALTNNPSIKQKNIDLSSKAAGMSAGGQARPVVIGQKVIQLDLRHKIFTIRAPE